MTEKLHQQSAKIYEFPKGRRVSSLRNRDVARVGMETAVSRLPNMEYGESWYHAAAIQEAEKAGKQ